MKKVFIILMVTALPLSRAAAQKNMGTDSIRLAEAKAAIDKGNTQWSEGWKKGDATLVADVFEKGGIQLSASGKIIRGRQHIAERQKAAMAGVDPGVIVTVTTTKIWLDGNTAYESGKYKYEYTEKGKPAKDEGLYVTIWKRQANGSWKLAMDMGVPQ